MKKYKVVFLPDEKEVKVAEGTTLFEAAEKAGVYINSLCGGEGVCGKCRVKVIKGTLKADKNALVFFTKDEIKQGYVLACQSFVKDDLELMVPPESRLEGEQIIQESRFEERQKWQETAPITYSQPDWVAVAKRPYDPAPLFSPLIAKVYLELPKPTGEDNIPDTARIMISLKKKLRYASYEMPINCLKDLSMKLRSSEWKITVTVARHNEVGRILQIEKGNTEDKSYGVAIDVGTTTVVAQLISLKTGKVVGVEGSHNLQARYGEDVLSRIAYACGKGSTDALQKVVVENINNLIQSLAKDKDIDIQNIVCVVVAGNTTMSHLLLDLSPCSIRDDPYVPTVDIYPQIQASELDININPNGLVWIMPSVASYIGGDIVAGIIACGLADKAETTCLIDIGTNGEIVIGNNEWMLSCSASAGPAFEGGDIKCGMRATRGAIQKVKIKNSEVSYETIGDAKPRGICGSGLIDLIYELARNGIIDIDARFKSSFKEARLVQGESEIEYIVVFPQETEANQQLVITQTDIDNIMRSKAAVFAAIKSLIDYAGLDFTHLEKIYVAGGFGNYLDVEKAISIGLLPDVPREHVEFIGNSSLIGARMALISCHVWEKSIIISQSITNVELSKFAPFGDEYMAALYIPHINRESLFPSVKFPS